MVATALPSQMEEADMTSGLRMVVLALAWVFVALAPANAALPSAPQLILQHPSLSRSAIAFDFGGQIWTVPRTGGEARVLVAGQGSVSGPIYSPDGSQLAFTSTYDGNSDVYVVASGGGEPRRLTYHPDADEALGWTPDGTRILFRSTRATFRDLAQFYTVPVGGGMPTQLPLPSGYEASFSGDGTHLAYTPFVQWQAAWKQYRGGQTARVWLADLATSHIEAVPRDNSNDRNPLWVDGQVYFLSDRDGPVTLYSYDLATHAVKRLLANEHGPDMGFASAGPGGIVYSQFGSLHLYEFASGSAHLVPVRIAAEQPQVRSHFETLDAQQILQASLSPTGKRVLFEARGEILAVPAEKGDTRNLTQSPGVADRNPAWSPDGKWVAWFSDESGEYALHLRAPDGLGAVRKIALGAPPSYFYDPTWSPDSKKIAYSDKRLNLWVIDLERPVPQKIDTDRFDTPNFRLDPAWSPDSRWLAYTKQLANHLHAVFVYGLADRQVHQLTGGLSDTLSPKFDRGGKYLYFLAGTDTGLGAGWLDMSGLGRVITSNVYAAVLTREEPSPVAPQSDEEGGSEHAKPLDVAPEGSATKAPGKGAAAPKPTPPPDVRIDFAGFEQRIVPLPIPAAKFSDLAVGTEGVLYAVAGPRAVSDSEMATGEGGAPSEVTRFELKTRKSERLLKAVDPQTFSVSADGSRVLYALEHKWFVVAADKEPKDGEGALRTDGVQIWIEPRAEWAQIYHEAWRIQRDFLYDPNFHGLDLGRAERIYAPFVAGLASRAELNVLMEEMTGHIGLGHTFIRGGALPARPGPAVGLLGADYRVVEGHVQFAGVLAGENWNPATQAPLTQPGVNVVAGDFLLAVNARPVEADSEVYRYFQGLAGKQTVLTVGPSADGKGSRNVTVVPVSSEKSLRLLTWMDANRRLVEERSGGRLAYVFVPDTAGGGFANFNRYFYSQIGKDAVIIDERFNHGGAIADFIVDQLKKTPQMINRSREGEDMIEPAQAIFGPKVMLVNEHSGSGGDALPWMFKKAAIGPLVGMRTWGGLVGISGYPPLIDGGSITAPRWGLFGTGGEWEVENIGIAPDIEVQQDPQLMREGGDPQLERGIAVALQLLAKSPPLKLKRAPAPDRHPVLPSFTDE